MWQLKVGAGWPIQARKPSGTACQQALLKGPPTLSCADPVDAGKWLMARERDQPRATLPWTVDPFWA
jgi:hypothetical protein